MSEEKLNTEELSTSWHSYPKIYNLGHAAIKNLFYENVIVEEKLDGSQFSFGKINGELRCRSKGAQLNLVAPEKMFIQGIEAVRAVEHLLTPGWTYRGEYLAKPKHNTLVYDRIPANHVMIFDINTGHETYLGKQEQIAECNRLGFESMPIVFEGVLEELGVFRTFLDRVSVLGGAKVEGVVVKQYKQFGADGKVLMGKFVSEEFKEVHTGEWRERNPSPLGVIEKLVEEYSTPARYQKAVQHLKERGQITNSPKDIGALIAECSKDIHSECEIEIKEKLFQFFWEKVRRGVTNGIPQWYKEQLLKQQFE